MQPALIQALMNVLPDGLEAASARMLQADGAPDFADLLAAMLPALEQQMASLPPETRASLMAELQREIRQAQAMADLHAPEGQALEAMLAPKAGEEEVQEAPEPVMAIETLLGMLGEAPRTMPLPGEVIPELMPPRLAAATQPAVTANALAAALPRLAGADSLPSSPAGWSAPAVAAFQPPQGSLAPAAEALAVAGDAQPSRELAEGAPWPAPPGGERGPQAPQGEPAARVVAPVLKAGGEEAAPVEPLAPGPVLPATEPLHRPPGLAGGERIPVPVHAGSEFAEAVGQRVMLMLGQQMQGARIELNPVDLGPLEIHLQLRGQEASVHFGAAHALTREVIEAALPRLREMLAEQGFTQVNVNVGQPQGQGAQGFSGQGSSSTAGGGQPWQARREVEAAESPVREREYALRSGGVDLFA